MSQSLGHFRVKAARPHSLVINKRSTKNVISTDRAIQAPHTERLVVTDNSITRQQRNKRPKVRPRYAKCELITARAEKARQGNATPKLIVDRIARCVNTGEILGMWSDCTGTPQAMTQSRLGTCTATLHRALLVTKEDPWKASSTLSQMIMVSRIKF